MPAALLVLACALWGLSFPLVKALNLELAQRLPDASPAYLSVWLQVARFSAAALMLVPLCLRHGRPTHREWRQGAELAVWGGAGMAFQTWGLSHTHASTSAFLTQAYCVILPLIAAVRLRRAPSSRTILATLIVIAGGAILSGIRPSQLTLGKGEIATLVSSFLFTFQILTLESPRFSANRGLPVTLTMSVAIAVLFLPVLLFLEPSLPALWQPAASPGAIGIILSLALFCSVGAYSLMNVWQPRVTSTEAGLIYTTEPIFASLFALFLPAWLTALLGLPYPNESLTAALGIGGSLILGANLLMQWKNPPPSPPSPGLPHPGHSL